MKDPKPKTPNNKGIFKLGTGEMTQWLRSLAALA